MSPRSLSGGYQGWSPENENAEKFRDAVPGLNKSRYEATVGFNVKGEYCDRFSQSIAR